MCRYAYDTMRERFAYKAIRNRVNRNIQWYAMIMTLIPVIATDTINMFDWNSIIMSAEAVQILLADKRRIFGIKVNRLEIQRLFAKNLGQ